MSKSANPLLAFVFFLHFSLLISTSHPFPLPLWPLPTHVSYPNPISIPISPSFHILTPNLHPGRHLLSAINRYTNLILSEHFIPFVPPSIPLSPSSPLLSLSLSIRHPSSPLLPSTNESYTLSISSTSGLASVSADTPWGAIRGLETFSQLAWGNPPVIAANIFIADQPIFEHRGLMLDTSRSYFPVRDLKRLIGAMAANKMNVFHWHITDAQSFPIELPSEPELAEKGAYGPEMRYSVEDVRDLVEFALDHGVRIVPEIDSPGHAGSWAGAHPDIITCANMFWLPDGPDNWSTRLASEPGTGQLNPLHPKTYRVLHHIFSDLASLFPDPFLHAGADEIAPSCWSTDPTIRSYLAAGKTLSSLLSTFINSSHPLITSLNRTAIYWEDVLLNAEVHVPGSLLPPSTTILQTWNNGPNNTKLIVSAGYRAIVSSSDFYYLDCGHGDFPGNDSSGGVSWCGPFKTWQMIYDYDILDGIEEEEEARLVLGGEVALWTEQADGEVLDGRVWPRAAAMAEALWSGNRDETGRKRYAEATDRLNAWRERMVWRGIKAEPIQPLWCRKNPGMCNLVK
ncbi:hypothetical protein M5K25_019585 [Dendrobium thyrsiflorum]|uniref:Beta-hexosaminidase n=1 Tax=Dendrobium thyrsiflorum TaxID=117978 RepID=A0ABD0UME7_DENTH